jgi:hypothetical protein
MSFVTNPRRGETMGVVSPTALPPASRSVNAIFENSRLFDASFSGDLMQCQFMFVLCLLK